MTFIFLLLFVAFLRLNFKTKLPDLRDLLLYKLPL